MNEPAAPRPGEKPGLRALLDFISRRQVRGLGYSLVILFFILLVLIPTVYVLTKAVTGWDDIQTQVISNPARMGVIWNAIAMSFGVAILVTLIDLLFGLPLAWFIVRRKFRGK